MNAIRAKLRYRNDAEFRLRQKDSAKQRLAEARKLSAAMKQVREDQFDSYIAELSESARAALSKIKA